LTFGGVDAVDEAELWGICLLIGRTQAGGVQQVKEVGAKFEVAGIGDGKALACCHVEVFIAGRAFRSDARGAKTDGRFLTVSADTVVRITCAIDFGRIRAKPCIGGLIANLQRTIVVGPGRTLVDEVLLGRGDGDWEAGVQAGYEP
jgi:hypothetical protein